jgi:sulfide:quinone oxidoreductase
MRPASVIEATDPSPRHVVIAGGGVAAVEGLLALRALAPSHVTIELVSPETDFVYRPLSVAQPFGLVEPARLPLEDLARDNGASFRRGALAEVDVAKRVMRTAEGAHLRYDSLLIAMGARARPILPGALTFRGPQDAPAFRRLLDELEDGAVHTIAFAVPRPARWSLPLYELALMTAARVATHGLEGVRLSVVTHERQPLDIFGTRVSSRLRQLLADAGIELRTAEAPVAVQPGRGLLTSAGGVEAERVVALAKLGVPIIPGIAQGPGGFIATDPHGRVERAPDVYAAGDVTWFPVKQGGLAAQQADAAAEAIAADAGARIAPTPFTPVLRGILLTGGTSQYLRGKTRGGGSAVSEDALWAPAAKVAGRYLAPYLSGSAAGELADAPPGDHKAALELALQAADAAAGWNDPAGALRWLAVAEGLNVALPVEYAERRREWQLA